MTDKQALPIIEFPTTLIMSHANSKRYARELGEYKNGKRIANRPIFERVIVQVDSDSDISSDDEIGFGHLRLNNEPVAQLVQEFATPTEAKDWFWQIIRSFDWPNKSHQVNTIVSHLPDIRRQKFKEIYSALCRDMDARFEAFGLFRANNINIPAMRAKVVSHCIALGRDQYESILDGPEFAQYFIDENECVSLDDLLPQYMMFG